MSHLLLNYACEMVFGRYVAEQLDLFEDIGVFFYPVNFIYI